MYDVIGSWTMSISDYLDEYFEKPVIKACQAVGSVIGTDLWPMSPGTVYVLLHHAMGDADGNVCAWGYARGGIGSITRTLTASFKGAGRETRIRSGVEQVLVRGGRAYGVALSDGQEVLGKRVLSNMDVRRTFLKHIEANEVPDAFLKCVRNFNMRGSSGKLNIALDRAPRRCQRMRPTSRRLAFHAFHRERGSWPMTFGRSGTSAAIRSRT